MSKELQSDPPADREEHSTTACAHPNIALVKYWGKQDKPGNLPSTPNLSITLSELTTTTTVSFAEADQLTLNGNVVGDTKVARFVGALRNKYDIPPIQIESTNNFPTGAGLASSASGFAALITALNYHCQLGLDPELMSDWARQGSASAARSIYGGFVALVPPLWRAELFAPASHWDLSVVVAITSDSAKSVSSTAGMKLSAATSPYYKTWVRSAPDDFSAAFEAIEKRDFERLTEVAELSCLKMHSVMLTSVPTLNYWNAATLACMDTVRALRAQHTPAFFTIDAGPQVKVICLPQDVAAVEQALAATPGVIRTISCGLGAGARLTAPA